MMTEQRIFQQLHDLADEEIATHSLRFFKSGKGEYGEGDKFLGIRVPVLRKLVKQYKHTELAVALELLKNDYHEVRLFALLLMVQLFEREKSSSNQQVIVKSYLAHSQYVNNWDLVDSSAHKILGRYLLDKDRKILYQLVRSNSLWERRIAMMATYYFIKSGQFDDTFSLAKSLLSDEHDLIHKIVGWMLREVGNVDHQAEIKFLSEHYQKMPRTMLRYAIEKFPKEQRLAFLHGQL